MPNAPRFSHYVREDLIEVPPSSLRLFRRNFPSSGGGYFRLLPYALSRWMIGRINASEDQPAVFYFHPWEIDPEQPRISGLSAKTRFRHYLNLGKVESRLERLLSDFRWGRMDHIFLSGSHREE
jgi:polysaccharide deacetylase family protein (PEP-CTERM system associated)